MDSGDIAGTGAARPPAIRKKDGLAETTRFLLVLFLAAVLLRSLFIAAFSIPSGSMLPRMMIGDYLFVAKWPYGYSRYSFPFGLASFDGRIIADAAERGDVVVFRYPGSDQDYVKRLIGLPGDMVQVRGGTLYLNGEAVQRTRIADFPMPVSPNSPCRFVNPANKRELAGANGERLCAYPRYRETLPGGKSYDVIDQADITRADDTEIFMVPEDHYFVMGDNRDDSLDSRFPVSSGGVGMLPAENLIGRGLITFFSTDGSAEWLKPWTWVSATRWDRIGETY
ncbi:signal peptidase I [Allosphingosinicella vermicomposti]|uniref:signal peptidase I n=1 Tax=Allosphingosinicella vermicomposti TaxID=614671 RepID=UPI000D0FFFC4|nr:signal peptidase I [Allosphingosinicella vermicomposti]